MRSAVRPWAGRAGLVAAFLLFPAFAPAEAGAAAAPQPREAERPGASAPGGAPAVVLGEGSRARRQLVAVGRDLVIAGEALADAAVLDGTVRVSGSVEGDVIALGGDVALAATARVGGDVFALGGAVDAAPGAEIGGRTASYPTASAAWLTLIEGPTLGLSPFSPVVLGAKLGLLAAWLVLVMLLFGANGREVLATSESVASEPFRGFVVGLTGVVTVILTALLLATFTVTLVGVPLLVLVVVAALVLKLWGMVAVFHALGDWLTRRLGRRTTPLNAATVGLLVLGVFKFVPYVGAWTWTAATLIGVGAALTTKLGRREPWFEAAVRSPT